MRYYNLLQYDIRIQTNVRYVRDTKEFNISEKVE